MSCQGRFHTRLHERGLRVTPQRKAILSTLHTFRSPFTAEEIFRKVTEVRPGVKLSTVYRTLELLRSIQLVSIVDVDDRGNHYMHVESESPHFHLVCRKCEGVIGVSTEAIHDLQELVLGNYGFEIEPNRVSLSGLCQNCRGGDA